MVSHFHEPESNSISDALYCEEEHFDEDLGGGFGWENVEIVDFSEICKSPSPSLSGHDFFWEDGEIVSLLGKEKYQEQLSGGEIHSNGSFQMRRSEAIEWMLKVIARYGFTAMTAVLAVNYYDRFNSTPCFQNDKPWMSHLAAVACLSIAAKVEETQVPLLLDLQVEESKYFFEAKTIQRGELLVLSTLQWKVNLVTPLSFFDHIVRRFGLITKLHLDFLLRCESLILVVITDHRLMHYLPSVIAAATMIYAIRETEPHFALEFENKLTSLLRTSKDKVDDCQKLIAELMNGHKRRYESLPRSPSGIVDAYFSSDSSSDSWATLCGSSSPEPSLFKRSRTQDQRLESTPVSSNMSLVVTDRP